MDFKTVKIGDAVHVSVNDVVSSTFARSTDGGWAIMVPRQCYLAKTLDEALQLIADGMGNWYTVAQAAEVLVEMGAFDAPPSTQLMSRWAREGRFPDAVKVPTQGSGGSWRFSEKALPAFTDAKKVSVAMAAAKGEGNDNVG